MSKCYIYPGLQLNDKCEMCELYGKCSVEKDEPLVFVSCRNCGFETNLKEDFVNSNGILCPICKGAILAGKKKVSRNKKG